MAEKSEKPRKPDERLKEREKGSELGLPSPKPERPYPGTEENRADKNFERPDEFGDGDRRS